MPGKMLPVCTAMIADHRADEAGHKRLLQHRVGDAEHQAAGAIAHHLCPRWRKPERMKPRKASSSQMAGTRRHEQNDDPHVGGDVERMFNCASSIPATSDKAVR